jgi:tetratricopeptide (TPR) repeat protein
VLSNRNKRAEYDRSLGGAPRATAPVAAPPASEPMAAAVPTPPAPPSAPAPDVLPPAPPPEPPPAAPVATVSPPSPVPSRASPAMPAISPEAAQRAAREALARKLGLRPGAAPPSVAGVGNAPRPADSAAALASPLASLDAMRVARTQAERDAKIAYLTRTADESLARNDLLGASNALAVAATLAPEDATLRARADDVARRLAMSFAVRNAEEARRAERSGDWAEAAACWQKVVNAHPQDAVALERAAHALLRLGRDLPRAAELARRATQQSPPRVEAYTTLAQIFIAGGLRASALGALETASKLDPASVVVKDLLAKVKA